MSKDVKNTQTEELSKKEVAEVVVTPKKRYFFPEEGKSVEAETQEDAEKKLNIRTK